MAITGFNPSSGIVGAVGSSVNTNLGVIGANGPVDPWYVTSSSITTQDTAITGQMLLVDFTMAESAFLNDVSLAGEHKAKEEIKMRLCHLMAEKMYKESKFDFSMQNDYQMGTITFRARIFVTPDAQTRIVRQLVK